MLSLRIWVDRRPIIYVFPPFNGSTLVCFLVALCSQSAAFPANAVLRGTHHHQCLLFGELSHSAKARTRQDTIEERVSRSVQANARERLLATVKVTTQSSAQLLPLSTHSDQLSGSRWKAMNHMEVPMRSRWTSSRRTLDEAVHADA